MDWLNEATHSHNERQATHWNHLEAGDDDYFQWVLLGDSQRDEEETYDLMIGGAGPSINPPPLPQTRYLRQGTAWSTSCGNAQAGGTDC